MCLDDNLPDLLPIALRDACQHIQLTLLGINLQQIYTLDLVLAVLLIAGGVVGGHFGAQAGQKLKGEQLRLMLALIVLAVAIRILFDLVLPPDDLYSLTPLGTKL